MIEKHSKDQVDLFEDYGLNNNLENLNIGIHRLLKLNNDLREENQSLVNKIQELELNIDTLIENNKDLVDILKSVNEKEKIEKEIQIVSPEINLEKTIDEENLKRVKSIEEYKYDLLEADKKDYCLLIEIIKAILSFKDYQIEDSFADYLINISQNILENHGLDITSIEVLDLIELIYEKLDEDLLIEFTETNYSYILKLIEETQKKTMNCIIKIGRILYSQEELIPADDYFSLIGFKYLRPYIKNKEEIIDILLIYNHLLGCKNREDIKHLWPEILKEGFIEANDITNYLRAHEQVNKGNIDRAHNTIQILKKRINYIEKIDEEVKGDLRRVSYHFMINELEKILKKIENTTKEKPKDTELLNQINKEKYFEHTLYMIKDDREKCPFDMNQLVETKIIEKIYYKEEDFNKEENPVYEELRISYCMKCENCFIKESYRNTIDGHIKTIPIEKNIIAHLETEETIETEYNLNEESPLRLRGYHTALSDNKRWDILINTCIPDMGANRVLFYLEGFVKRFSAQKKDYSKSIRIWNNDIKKIKKHMNSLNK